MTLSEVEVSLRHPEGRTTETSNRLSMALKELKSAAVEKADQTTSKQVWCLEEVLHIQRRYAAAFSQLQEGEFLEAWSALVDIETAFGRLSKHHPLDDYHLLFISEHSAQFQRLFPFKLFLSIGAIASERRCGLCDAVITPRGGCQHRKGEIYDGEMCFHVIATSTVDHVAIVERPANKNCVLMTPGTDDRKQYALLDYVIAGLESPYHAWQVWETKTRHPHRYFVHLDRDDPCPCDSGGTYEACCLGEAGVLRPHFEFSFAVPPPVGHQKVRYYYD